MQKNLLGEFEKKLDEGTDEEIQEFIRKNISNLDEVTAMGLMKYKKLYLGNIDE